MEELFVPGETISFADWFVVGTPHAIMGVLISWSIIFLIIKPEIKTLPATRNKLKASLKSMGKMQREEKAALAILTATMFLWIMPSLLRSFVAVAGDDGAFSGFVSASATNIREATPALTTIMAIAIVRTGRNRPPLLKWNEIAKAVDRNIVLLFGSSLVLAMGMQASWG